MDDMRSNRQRTDEQLYAALFEVRRWVVHGAQGRSLGIVPNLRLAIEKAGNFARGGAVVVSLSRLPTNDIVVFPDQIRRVETLIVAREMPSATSQRG